MDDLSDLDYVPGLDILEDMCWELAKDSKDVPRSEVMKRVFEHVLNFPDEKFFKVVEETKLISPKKLLETRQKIEFKKKLSILKASPLEDCYDESDQTPVTGVQADYIKIQLWSNLDMMPCKSEYTHLSDWMKVIWCGDYDGMMAILKHLDEDGVKKLVNKRETMFNIGAVFHVIDGARILLSDSAEDLEFRRIISYTRNKINVKNHHMKVLKKLISLGVDVNSKDFAGYTPLHFCVSLYGNEVCFRMARLLLESGADVDSQNRFGTSPLLESYLKKRPDLFNLFLKYGANPFLKDHMGKCPQDYFKKNSKFTAFVEAVNNNEATKVEENDLEAGDEASQNKCELCHKSKRNLKRCTGCYMVWYCGNKCQARGWEGHKVECKKFFEEYKMVRITDQKHTIFPYFLYPTEIVNLPEKSHFVVRVQIDKEHPGHPLLVFNDDRSLYGHLSKNGNENVYEVLKRIGRPKGYFRAILKTRERKNSKNVIELKINPSRRQIVEHW